jgi:ribosomal protein S27E
VSPTATRAAIPALGSPRYRPRSADTTLRSLVETHLDELRRVHDDRFARKLGPLTPRVLDLFERFLRCGDPHFGFLRLRCETCDHERLLPFSCKTRGLCPSCGKRRATDWALRFVEEVLPAPRVDAGDHLADEPAPISSLTEPTLSYLPLVFTIPKMLRPAFLFDRTLSRLLCRAAYAVVRNDFAAHFPYLDRPVPAFVAAPQSFGTLLTFHPHVHALVSSGVFDREGSFHPIPPDEAAERLRALEIPFRNAVLHAFLRRGTIDDDRADLLRSWEHSGFSVHSERAIPAADDDAALTSILEYFARPAVSERRLTELDTGLVLYQGTFHPGLGRDHQLWTGVEFLAHLVPHIQHRYECRIHTYGALSTTIRKRFGWLGKRPVIRLAGEDREGGALVTLGTAPAPSPSPGTTPATTEPSAQGPGELAGATSATPGTAPAAAAPAASPSDDDHDEPDHFTRSRKRRWAELIRHVWLDDPEICENCGGWMRIAGVSTSPRDDDAIRQELEARGAWDPPWARAPPKSDPNEAPTTMSGDPSEPSSPHDPLPTESTHPDPWDDEWVPDPWAEEESDDDDPDIARADDLED